MGGGQHGAQILDTGVTSPHRPNEADPIPGRVDESEIDDFGLPARSEPETLSLDQHETSDDEADVFEDAAEPEGKKSDDLSNGIHGLDVKKDSKSTADSGQIEKQEATLRQSAPPSYSKNEATRDAEPFPSEPPPEYSNESGNEPLPVAVDSPRSPVISPTSPGHRKSMIDSPIFKRVQRDSQPRIAEWSHQKLGKHEELPEHEEEEVEWQAMPAIDQFDVYDDNGRLVARGDKGLLDEEDPYSNIGGAGKGYTRVLLDEDAMSANSMDEDTDYLFHNREKTAKDLDAEQSEEDDEEEARDMLSQLDATKNLLTEGQRIAYVGVVRLLIHKMMKALEDMERTRATKKETIKALESLEIWGQLMMVRLYGHMDINTAEQIMIEQLADHGVEPADLVPTLMQNVKVQNPMSSENDNTALSTPDLGRKLSSGAVSHSSSTADGEKEENVPEVHGIESMPKTRKIDLDLRWTVLCDLFLVLLADSSYDARSRRLLERVGSALEISWVQICRFEKRVIDQLELQETERENWDESEHLENRRKQARTRKYVFMGLATVGGGLVIGLSAGLLAPVIGAGLAAGFTTIGVTGTAGFLGGVGGAALITSAATAAGGTIAVRASHRRTGHVRTFEYRPLHNNKRLNLILAVSGWMTGKVDDVRLPFSTVDPIMGDIYSLYWEPEMLQSMGDTIGILATEALTQTIQQVLGSTILVALMAALQLPVVLTKLAYLIDNPWSVSLDRAWATGLILADSLIARHLGQRPVTLVGFSLGARVVFSCLKELSARGAYGLVQNVYLFGSPIVAKKDEYLRARSVISGRFVNGYAANDWILGYLFRATSGGIMRVAGLAPVEGVPGLENVDVTDLVNGHMAYRSAMPKLLRKMNWEVESDEFTEIEDPDPDNHEQRQRELIAEIDEARRKAEEKPKKIGFAGLFKRKAEKKMWEVYDANAKTNGQKKDTTTVDHEANMWGEGKVLFDIDAIRRELAGEQIDVRELDSTMPPMQISTVKDGEKITEYLRLPPGISPDEVKKMKLPPRPDQIEDELPPGPDGEKKAKRASLFGRPLSKPSAAPKDNQQQVKKLPNGEQDLIVPRQIESTLPPLQLSPSLQEQPPTGSRPPIQSRNTMPERTPPEVNGSHSGSSDYAPTSPLGLASPKEILEMQHNAWAGGDGDNDDEIKMTFA